MAEGAIECAADLTGDAKRAGLVADRGNVDTFTFNAGAKAHQPFLSAINRHFVFGNFRPVQCVGRSEAGTEVFAEIGHRGKILRADMVHPAAQLFGAHICLFWLNARALHLCLKSRQGQTRQ